VHADYAERGFTASPWRPGLTLEDIRGGVSRLQGGYALESCGSFFTLAISLAALERLT
jgi:hypothetical protein